MQSQGGQLGRERDPEDRTERLLSQHELDQEYLYRLWKAGRLNEKYVQMWAKALTELRTEADCDYFTWLLKNQPALV